MKWNNYTDLLVLAFILVPPGKGFSWGYVLDIICFIIVVSNLLKYVKGKAENESENGGEE